MVDKSSQPVRYVLAVSGGVDSVVLLDIMAGQLAGHELVVAHFDHGIRPDSAADRQFVADLAQRYRLPFEYAEGQLGAKASEAVARQARYGFLHEVRQRYGAQAIATAHHEDDVLETAILNLLRGTGRKGLSSLQTTDDLYRPLLRTPKAHMVQYARRRGLQWREDSTNSDTAYLRNYVRLRLLPRLDSHGKQHLREIVAQAQRHNQEIDRLLAAHLRTHPASDRLDRLQFILLPHAVAKEVMAAWLRSFGIVTFDRKTIERLTITAKTYQSGKRADINRYWQLAVGQDELLLDKLERPSTHRG